MTDINWPADQKGTTKTSNSNAVGTSDFDGYSQGFRTHRFKDNPLEQKFAEEWVKRNKESKILLYLTSPSDMPADSNLCERDKIVAGAVVQWLGSPVGLGFLRDVLGIEISA